MEARGQLRCTTGYASVPPRRVHLRMGMGA